MKLCLCLGLVLVFIWTAYAVAGFTENNLIVVNDPSAMSAGMDSLDEFSPDGALVFSQASMPYGILYMTLNGQNRLFVANRENDTILVFDSDGNAQLFADASDGLRVPSSMSFILPESVCIKDFDTDTDVDGVDLREYVLRFDGACLDEFAGNFGNPGF